MAIDPVVKEFLEGIKNAICGTGEPATGGIVQVVGSTAGELSQSQKDDAEDLLRDNGDGAQDRVETLLNESEEPSFDPPSLGSTFTEYDPTGKTTQAMILDACQQACDALDDYCDEEFTAAARMTRRLETTIIAFRDSAGMTE